MQARQCYTHNALKPFQSRDHCPVGSLVATVNTVADFVLAPVVGGLIDAFGRKTSLLLGQALDAGVR